MIMWRTVCSTAEYTCCFKKDFEPLRRYMRVRPLRKGMTDSHVQGGAEDRIPSLFEGEISGKAQSSRQLT